MAKVQIAPNTTLYPAPVVIISCGEGVGANLITLNRIASINAEPPMVCLSVRPRRASHDLIESLGEFVVNIPWPDMELVADFIGTTTAAEVDKWSETGLSRLPASVVRPPLVAECPVNLECQVREIVRLPSHSMFVAEVVAIHADAQVLDARQEVDFNLAGEGLAYRSGAVREKPVDKFDPEELLRQVRQWRDRQ